MVQRIDQQLAFVTPPLADPHRSRSMCANQLFFSA